MILKKGVLALGVVIAFSGSVAHAGAETQYQALLAELKQNTCTMKNGSFMAKAKAATKQKGINNRISSTMNDLKASDIAAYNNFQKAHAKVLSKGC